ncbi:Putative receptor-like protein kinase At1g80870 [Linum perenne]
MPSKTLLLSLSSSLSSSLPPPPPLAGLTKSKILFLSLTITATTIIIFTLLYFLYHLCHSFLLQLNRSGQSRTIPFDAPLNKLKRFIYSDLKLAANDSVGDLPSLQVYLGREKEWVDLGGEEKAGGEEMELRRGRDGRR